MEDGYAVSLRSEGCKLTYPELASEAIIIGSLIILYPIRLTYYLASHNSFERWPSIVVPSAFDPAVLLYPPLLANYTSILLANGNGTIVLVNMALGISSLLTELLPSFTLSEGLPALHWLLSCIPLYIWQTGSTAAATAVSSGYSDVAFGEHLTYLFPLHRMMFAALRQVASTSLLETEVQLLSIALINLFYLAQSPAMIVLKALLWVGGVSLALFGTPAFKWLGAVERVPKWRFRRFGSPKHALKSQPKSMLKEPLSKLSQVLHFDRPPTLDSEDEVAEVQRVKPMTMRSGNAPSSPDLLDGAATSDAKVNVTEAADIVPSPQTTTPATTTCAILSPAHTPSGQKKSSRSASKSLAKFYNFTETEATIRKYIYASYIYILILLTAFLGVWKYVHDKALGGLEPVGWALSYLFGDLQWFRWKVTLWNLNSWIVLPPHRRTSDPDSSSSSEAVSGWIEQKRDEMGHANTRLLISAYLLAILFIGLTTVLTLSRIPSVAVDTRRKVFHFMMVAMLTPTIFIDPSYISFALALILAVFLLLDLLRSGCVPPISKPLNWFLAPYVDGRDLRGPVVVSHIFLLIGCATPLWLSLGTLPIVSIAETTEGKEGVWPAEKGWGVADRDISMLAGVICVGMGDAFASLIGRRYGRNKWIWPGGKSIEGSVAFAVAVTFSLLVGKGYLIWGGWEDVGMKVDGWESVAWIVVKSALAATVASLTEAVLTGGNDNVVVPVVFWMTVKGLRI